MLTSCAGKQDRELDLKEREDAVRRAQNDADYSRCEAEANLRSQKEESAAMSRKAEAFAEARARHARELEAREAALQEQVRGAGGCARALRLAHPVRSRAHCCRACAIQEEQLRQAQKADELRRKKAAAQEERDRTAVLEELRSLDVAASGYGGTRPRPRLRRPTPTRQPPLRRTPRSAA
jgi:hypothetical protein